MNQQLFTQFDEIFTYCFDLFQKKQSDYGPSWLLYRPASLNDEIWRKAKRIRTLEENKDMACIPEGRDSEYVGIINYCVMFLISISQMDGIPTGDEVIENLAILETIGEDPLLEAYQSIVKQVKELMMKKNTDYGDAWQSMSLYSMTDQIIIRSYRIKSILKHDGICTVSEGVGAQLCDIINYCIFALIKMDTSLCKLHG